MLELLNIDWRIFEDIYDRTTAFLQGIYNNYGTRSVNGKYLKAQEILNTIEMGLTMIQITMENK